MYKNYAALRDKKGLTDYRVAMDTGISTATLSSWKNGAYTPKSDKLLVLAKYFGVSVEELLEEQGGK